MKVYYYMTLIAATQAEGGLVLFNTNESLKTTSSYQVSNNGKGTIVYLTDRIKQIEFWIDFCRVHFSDCILETLFGDILLHILL